MSDRCKHVKQELIDVLSVISNARVHQTQHQHISAGSEERCTSCNEIKTQRIFFEQFLTRAAEEMEDRAPPSFFLHNPLTKANSLFQFLLQFVCTPLSFPSSLSFSPRGDAVISPLPLCGVAVLPACTELALAPRFL